MLDPGAFGTGLLIGLREGVEAALVVAIVLAYLARSGRRDAFGAIWLGTGAAIAGSVILGVAIFVTIGELGSPYEQLFEATTMLVATAIATWMLFWMRRQAAAIRGHLVKRIDQLLGEGGVFGLALLAFSSVIREGIEASLFVVGQATAVGRSDSGSVVAGAIAGLLVAAVLGYGFYRGSRRINLAAFFRWTGIALIFVAAGLVSRAVHELIEINVVTFAARPVFDLSHVLSDEQGVGALLRAILGYSATPEGIVLATYLVYLAAILTLYLRPLNARVPPARPSRGEGVTGAAA